MNGDAEAVPIVAVASGKGGVGKTTVAVNLALALTAAGRRVIVVVVVTPQAVAHQDVRRLIAHLDRHPAHAVGGIGNMAGFACPCCGTTAPLFPAAPDGMSIWGQVSKMASIPFSPRAAADADEGRPVMLTRSVPEQVAAYESAAAQVRRHLDGGEPPARA